MTVNNEYNILMCNTENYLPQTLVVMLSAINNINKKINFYIMQDDWSDRAKSQLINFLKQFPPHTASFLDVSKDDLRVFKPWKGRYEVYYKIIAHKYLPDTVDKILYLDSDAMIRKDIEEFYSLDFDDNYFIATNNRMEVRPDQTYDSWVKIPKSDRHRRTSSYSNPGVIIINAAKLRKEKIDIDFYQNQINQMSDDDYFVESGIINFCFWDKRRFVPSYKYQAMLGFVDVWKKVFKLSKEERIAKYNEAYHEDFDDEHALSIVHFVCVNEVGKPWHCIFDRSNDAVYNKQGKQLEENVEAFYKEWWNIAKKLPDPIYEQILTEAAKNVTAAPLNRKAQLMKNAKNFFENIAYDFVGASNLAHYIQMYGTKKIAILKAGDVAGKFFLHMLRKNNVDVFFQTQQSTLMKLSDEEWKRCRQADIIISCSVHGGRSVERDGICPVMIQDLLNDNTEGASNYTQVVTYNALVDTILKETKLLKEDVKNQTEALHCEIRELHANNERLDIKLNCLNDENGKLISELGKVNAANNQLSANLSNMTADNAKLNTENVRLSADNVRLNTEIGRLSGEKEQLTERLSIADKHSESLSRERDSLGKAAAKFESEAEHYEKELNSASEQNSKLTAALHKSESSLEAANARLEAVNAENNRLAVKTQEADDIISELRNRLSEMENSRSWRITKPLRSAMRFFRRSSEKEKTQ